jgi:hypothetical protein
MVSAVGETYDDKLRAIAKKALQANGERQIGSGIDIERRYPPVFLRVVNRDAQRVCAPLEEAHRGSNVPAPAVEFQSTTVGSTLEG